ncbi:hypothetical protein [Vallitalea guaymasensis]|uniref:hypothetical protein n=1 Tax=Vallitalea guaymasensis TaxID=1185412 RepID=UPI000DE20941|nr:hypothetical protein [Vallitalea guaymasensis]
MNRKIILPILIVSLLLFGCQNKYSDNNTSENDLLEFNYDFQNGTDGWMGGLAGIDDDSLTSGFDINFAHADYSLDDNSNKGIYLTSSTKNNNMFMYTTKKLTSRDGLSPLSNYEVDLRFDILPAKNNNESIPMDRLFIKAAVVNIQPSIEVIEKGNNNYLFVNPNTEDASKKINLTTLGNASTLRSDGVKTFQESFNTTTNSNGEMWVIIGVDSDYKGNGSLFLDNIKISINRI